jgi:hypothetical protein
MNTKDFIRLGIPLGEATRWATDFVSQFILSGGDCSGRHGGSEQIGVVFHEGRDLGFQDEPEQAHASSAVGRPPQR